MTNRTTSFAFQGGTRRSSLQFGDFPTFEEIRRTEKFGIDHITAAKFWFYFRLYLPFIALVTFILMFLIPLFIADNDDGFAFYGSLLSLVSCSLVVLSFFHVVPWRRHPSSLMLQISITSIIASVIVLVQSFPSGKYFNHFDPGGLNLIGSTSYSSDADHSPACQTMSFFIQLALLAREMWVFSLSMDLVTSITNPFASYRANVQKYHTIIWTVALVSATVLVNQPSCQGQFLADGTCWIRISGSQSLCFWGYFLSWVVVCYLISVLAMLYAYIRISRGLESTYATRYACVADTFRVVFFYIGYCIIFYFFLSFVYIQPISDSNIKLVESIYAYFIASRGFFDALVWFFSHGFSNNDENTNFGIGSPRRRGIMGMVNENKEYDNLTGKVRTISKPQLRRQPTLTMADIVPPRALRRGVYSTIRAACRCLTDLIGCSCGVSLQSSKSPSADHTGMVNGPNCQGEGEEEGEDEQEQYNLLDNAEEGGAHTSGLSESSHHPSNTQHHTLNTRPTEEFKISEATTYSTGTRHSSSGFIRPSQLSRPSTAATSVQDRNYLSDVDLSPQLNFALRAELLYLVTLGIKESVLRLDQRDLHVLMAHSGIGGDGHGSTHPNVPSGYSPGNSRSGASFLSPSLSYGVPSTSFTYSPTHRNTRGNTAPQFTRPSMLRRDISSGSLAASAAEESGSSPNSLRFPPMPGVQQASTAAGQHQHGGGSYSFSASQAGSRIQYALKSILAGVMGMHVPGEYGRDPIASSLPEDTPHHAGGSQQPLRSSMSSSVLQHSPIYPATGMAGPQMIHSNTAGILQSPPWLAQQGRSPNSGGPRGSLGARPSAVDRNVFSPGARNTIATLPDDNLSETDLSYNNTSSLQEQLLEENIEILQQQYAPPPPLPAPAEVIFNLNNKHQFRDFRPATFRKLRQMCKLPEDHYLELISQPTKERLSEGASGAFFFYCGDGELVVKTVEKHEASTLLKILDQYLSYLQSRPDSLLVRFLGLHSISMYGNEFNFVVMKNIFPANIRMNDKYDIKGSWINRHATRKAPGKRATCKYCYELFIEGSSDKCPEVVGGHEAVVTLKDSDMINKIRLYPDHAYSLIDVLNSDSDALCAMGMMDYSLLVGVKTMQYEIDQLQLAQQNQQQQQQQNMPTERLSSFSDAPGELHMNIGISASKQNTTHTTGGKEQTFAHTDMYESIYSTRASTHTTAAGGPGGNRGSVSNVPFESRPSVATNVYEEQQEEDLNLSGNLLESPLDAFISPGYPARAVVAPSAYYLGVIDILQTWSWSKRLEYLFKVYILRQPAAGISCLPPEEYKQRYQKKMAGIIEHAMFIREVTGSWQGKRHISVPFTLTTNRSSSQSDPTSTHSLASGQHCVTPTSSLLGQQQQTVLDGGSSSGALYFRNNHSALTGILEEGNSSLRISECSTAGERVSGGGETVSHTPIPLD